jgi:glutamate dehydrogenase (NADP+)
MFDPKAFLAHVQTTNPNEPEFHQAVSEVMESIKDFVQAHPVYQDQKILERLVEPERVIMFRVPWMDDA